MNYYSMAIDELMKDKDWKKIAACYAKKHPADFVRDCKNIDNESLKPVMNLIKADKKIEAIKEYRKITGAHLKDAKEDVEHLMEVMGK